MAKWVYTFGDKEAEGSASMKDLLGGKGANLAEMSNLGLAVPPGFTITTEVCDNYYNNNKEYPSELSNQVLSAIKHIEIITGSEFGNKSNPLLVSVRSGAKASMPGMMDTVLNLGLNDETVEGLASSSENDKFAWDSYRRFIQMYGDVVMGIPHYKFEKFLEDMKLSKGVENDSGLDSSDLKRLVKEYKELVKIETKENFPQKPIEQLWGAIGSVFNSWMNQRAITYRKINNIPMSWGTAVNVQAMVFGNMGETSATGVAFTRNPSNGEKSFFGEFLINAQGEDVVAGIRTPQNLTRADRVKEGSEQLSMEEIMPDVFEELVGIYQKLEEHYKDMQDIEFTVQRGKLWMLQTRNGKRTGRAAIKIAVDMVLEGLITKEEALVRIDPTSLDQLLHPMINPDSNLEIIANGLPASPGAASGAIIFTADEAESEKSKGKKVILVREETSPEDIHGMHAAEGILTSRGGMTSHAAVVARGMGTPCVSGVSSIRINLEEKYFTVGEKNYKEGEFITLDGSKGQVILGEAPMIKPELNSDFIKIINWSDEFRKLNVRTNAETPADAKIACEFGAEGIGLCRTEHMFFEADRIINVRQMILAEDESGRKSALSKLLPVQKNDFKEIFKIMKGLPVTIRLLDPPLHEFLPNKDNEIEEISKISGVDKNKLKRRSESLKEVNPMLGHRGCRLGISYPEIYEMQARAIFEAAIEISKETGENICPEVMIPLIATKDEFNLLKEKIDEVAKKIMQESNSSLDYLVGTMIELPRAALCADEVAINADFFSFGTNDLTQTALGISRDDSASFLDDYLNNEIFSVDPFVSIDQKGVGKLVKIGHDLGRKSNSKLKVGICGEHGGDPESINFFNDVGLDYVSASPYRVPVARLAAAQAEINLKKIK
ncbi:MAG: pyruvate, phosphate dikinase [Rhodospirillaceae bacterium]|nr:pyruvate, phosphate dikinase [Rhodospirillaceae bacterium]